MTTTFADLNWLGVFLAALSAFLLGGIWYGPLFAKLWMQENNFREEDLKQRNMGMVFGVAFILAFLASINLAMFIGPEADITFGGMAGFLAGLGWVAMFTGIQYLFEMKSLKLYLVNAGYSVIALTIMGIILGAF